VDFHALRHTYISRLVASGANIKVAQELARHSTPTLTLGRYAHIQLVDQTRALGRLPSIDAPRANVVALAAKAADLRRGGPIGPQVFQRPFSAPTPRYANTCRDLPRKGVR
jgi:hypothetical protein